MVSCSKTSVAEKQRWEWVHLSCVNFWGTFGEHWQHRKALLQKFPLLLLNSVNKWVLCSILPFSYVKPALFMLIAKVAYLIVSIGFQKYPSPCKICENQVNFIFDVKISTKMLAITCFLSFMRIVPYMHMYLLLLVFLYFFPVSNRSLRGISRLKNGLYSICSGLKYNLDAKNSNAKAD